ncbi:MAG: hypothetical protein ACYTG6_15475, partial [Planctomycetota bacterium]
AKETGKPILICINMDGEIASEHYAGVRYRQREVAELYDQYVTVIASVYRHNPRDYDDEGHRIPCPRFGGVTCGEHIWIEPIIFEKFCDGQRVAPRHIAVDLDDQEAYDVYYVNDTASVFDSVREGRDQFPPAKPDIVRGDRPLLERVASRHVEDRNAVEEAYQQGDKDLRRSILEEALKSGDAAQLDLLRLAVFGLDVDQSQLARQALSQAESPAATKLISEALQVPMDESERDALIAALQRLGETSALARWLAGVHQGLGARSSALDPAAWAESHTGGATYAPRPDADTLTTLAEGLARVLEANPDDPGTHIDFAEATLGLAMETPATFAADPGRARLFARHLYEDAKRAALEAERLGETGWRVNMVLALAAYYTGDIEEAYARAAAAMENLPAGDTGWHSMAVVTIFAESRWKAIKAAVKAKEEYPPEWLGDLHAAYGILMNHPLGTDTQVAWHYEFLVWLGADHRADRFLREGIKRFPASQELHLRLHDRLLERRGAAALEFAYDQLLKEDPESARLAWFAGAASVRAAEHHRRQRRWDRALRSYEHAIERFELSIVLDEAFREAADHQIALVLAGRARVALQVRHDELALKEMLASFARRPESAGDRDGMGITPGETAQMLLARLRRAEDQGPAETLEAALAEIDPELLRPDRGLLGDEPGG